MDNNDRYAIEALFDKLKEVERRGAQRDPEAEAFIRSRIASQPGAPYYMAQTIIVQEQALEAAQARLEQLEGIGGARQGGGFFSDLFGGSRQRPPARGRSVPSMPAQPSYGQGGGGFLAGAAQTALGVAGGVLLGSMIAGAFGGGEAEAAEPEPEPQDEGNFGDDAGGDFDGGGDF